MSWDQTAVLVAVRGHEKWFDVKKGKIVVDANGGNAWNGKEEGHSYLILKVRPEEVGAEIEALMMHQPVGKR